MCSTGDVMTEYIFTGDPTKPATMRIINDRMHFTDLFRSLWGYDPWSEYRNSWHTMWEVKTPNKITEYQRLKS